jgi:hypothetical protein
MSRRHKAELRGTALHLIQSIVEKHSGTTEIGSATDTMNCNSERIPCPDLSGLQG